MVGTILNHGTEWTETDRTNALIHGTDRLNKGVVKGMALIGRSTGVLLRLMAKLETKEVHYKLS